MSGTRRLRIGVLAHEFLINIGANDLLRNILRGLASDPSLEIVFLCPPTAKAFESLAPAPVRRAAGRFESIRKAVSRLEQSVEPAAAAIGGPSDERYGFYLEACPRLEFVPTPADPDRLPHVRDHHGIDVFLPSIHPLPDGLDYVTYWPDCQPKHLPEFFDDESQRVRDARIRSLIDSGRPMIINSRDAKGDMVRHYGADPDRIFELPFAPIVDWDALVPRPELAAAYGLAEPYVLVCNQFWIHKSLETVLEAARIALGTRPELQFVFTGRMEEPRRPGYVESLHRFVAEHGLEANVRFLGYIPKADQLEIMKRAVAVVQPTLFEGGPGGGSAYDAVALGVRVIASDIPVNRELPLEPGRVELFRTRDATDLLQAIERMLDQPYRGPSVEDLFQASRRSVRALGLRLREAIDTARSGRAAMA
jgi:glycosyltransferase involved in cell wall biosynthesis